MKTSRLAPYSTMGGLALLASLQAFAQTGAGLPSRQGFASPAERDAYSRSAYARGDATRAAAALNESVRVNPFDPVALNNLAVNYAAQGDYQNALSLLERAMRIAPNRSDIVNNHANLRAWMLQDAQYASGSRSSLAPLNFPRAEDSPPEPPPLWSPPQPLQNPPVSARPVPQYAPQGMQVAPQAYAPQAPAMVPAQSANTRYGAPVYATPPQPYPAQAAPMPPAASAYGYAYPAPAQPVYTQPMQAQAAAPVPATTTRGATAAALPTSVRGEAARAASTPTKKKPLAARPLPVDCRVEP